MKTTVEGAPSGKLKGKQIVLKLPRTHALAVRPRVGRHPRAGDAHQFLGYRVEVLKTIVFSVAGAVAGLAGGLYACHEGFVWPSMPSILGVVLSSQIILYCLFGGTGTLVGAILGVIAIEGLS